MLSNWIWRILLRLALAAVSFAIVYLIDRFYYWIKLKIERHSILLDFVNLMFAALTIFVSMVSSACLNTTLKVLIYGRSDYFYNYYIDIFTLVFSLILGVIIFYKGKKRIKS